MQDSIGPAVRVGPSDSKWHKAHEACLIYCSDALLLVSPTPQSWKILYCNEACEQLLETPDMAEKKLEFWDIFDVSSQQRVLPC
jgi:hypothetical protein